MSASVKVLMLVENNGYPRDFRVRREALALRDAGYAVSVICPRDPGQPWVESVEGVTVHRFPAPPGGSGPLSYAVEFGYATLAMLLLSLWVALRRGVDVVHAANPPDTLFVIGAIFRIFGKRFIFDHHDLAPEVYLSRFANARHDLIHAGLRLLERCSYAVADVVIATNDPTAGAPSSEAGRPPRRFSSFATDHPCLISRSPPRLADSAEFLIGYIGTIGPQDGVDYWLRAIRKLVTTLGDATSWPSLSATAMRCPICARSPPARHRAVRLFHGADSETRVAPSPVGVHVACSRIPRPLERPVDDEQDDGVHGVGKPRSRST